MPATAFHSALPRQSWNCTAMERRQFHMPHAVRWCLTTSKPSPAVASGRAVCSPLVPSAMGLIHWSVRERGHATVWIWETTGLLFAMGTSLVGMLLLATLLIWRAGTRLLARMQTQELLTTSPVTATTAVTLPLLTPATNWSVKVLLLARI
mgnify:CR=1 FL=1